MSQAIGVFIFLFFLGAALVATTWLLTLRLAPEPKRARIARWLLTWSLKGLLLPLVLWAILNVGVSRYLQPFMPEVQAARNHGGRWFPEYLFVNAKGLFLVSTYWSAMTLGWVVASALQSADRQSRQEFKALCLTCVLVLGIPSGLILFCAGLPAAGFAGMLLLAPIAGYSRDFLQPRKLPPMYARAIARMKFGKYAQAETEILKELENWEDDFEGWMMLAELYANQFNSLGEAEQTVLDICAQPHTTLSQIAIALHRLADWHLKLGKDPEAARRALLMICDRLKGTHLAHMAQLRIDQLPASATELREQQNNRAIPLPALGDQLDEPADAQPIDRNKAANDANALVEQLNQNPNNVAAREKLARVLAERLDKAPLGIEQLELLLGMPDRSDAERAGWMGQIAAWQIKYRHDYEKGCRWLERLAREYPKSVQAFAARRRLELLGRRSNQI
jgi:thioredoxin-like negative regulator of GroEL